MIKNSKGFVQIIIPIILALTVFAGIGYFALKNGLIKINGSQKLPLIGPGAVIPPKYYQVSPTPELTYNPISDWKTYRNEKYSFSLQYPPNWNLSENKDPLVQDDILINPKCNIKTEKVCPQINILLTKGDEEDLKLHNNNVFNKVTKTSKFIIDGIEATQGFWLSEVYNGTYSGQSIWYTFLKQDNIFVLSYTEDWSTNQYEPLNWLHKNTFDQILSTFHFLNSPSETPAEGNNHTDQPTINTL